MDVIPMNKGELEYAVKKQQRSAGSHIPNVLEPFKPSRGCPAHPTFPPMPLLARPIMPKTVKNVLLFIVGLGAYVAWVLWMCGL